MIHEIRQACLIFTVAFSTNARRDLCLLIDLRPLSDPADKVSVSVLCFFFFFVTSRILPTQTPNHPPHWILFVITELWLPWLVILSLQQSVSCGCDSFRLDFYFLPEGDFILSGW